MMPPKGKTLWSECGLVTSYFSDVFLVEDLFARLKSKHNKPPVNLNAAPIKVNCKTPHGL